MKIITKFLLIGLVFLFSFLAYSKTHYKTYAWVEDTQNNIITFKDLSGNLWEYEKEKENFKEGQIVTIKFNTNGTKNKTDDKIVKVH